MTPPPGGPARELATQSRELTHTKQALRLWLKLLGAASLIEKELRARILSEYDMTLPRFDVLSALARAGAPGLAMGELSHSLRVSNGNVTGIVDRLIRDGLVERQGSSNRRTVQVRLTAAGAKAFAVMAKSHETWVEEIFAHLSQSEMDACIRALSRLRDTAPLISAGAKVQT